MINMHLSEYEKVMMKPINKYIYAYFKTLGKQTNKNPNSAKALLAANKPPFYFFSLRLGLRRGSPQLRSTLGEAA